MKINVTINDNLLKEIDQYCEENYIPRSTFLATSANKVLKENQLISEFKKMNVTLEKIAEKNNATDEQLKELQEIQFMLNLLSK